jgi:hypothetical protein
MQSKVVGSGRLGDYPRGSHGSGRADFPHPALHFTGLLRGRRCELRAALAAETLSEFG